MLTENHSCHSQISIFLTFRHNDFLPVHCLYFWLSTTVISCESTAYISDFPPQWFLASPPPSTFLTQPLPLFLSFFPRGATVKLSNFARYNFQTDAKPLLCRFYSLTLSPNNFQYKNLLDFNIKLRQHDFSSLMRNVWWVGGGGGICKMVRW